MIRNRIAASVCAISVSLGLALSPEARAGVFCYDKSAYSSNFVSAVQESLAREGFDPGPVDGKWGAKTERALTGYQRSKGLPATGGFNPGTLKSLFGPDASAEAYGLARNRSMPSEIFEEECR